MLAGILKSVIRNLELINVFTGNSRIKSEIKKQNETVQPRRGSDAQFRAVRVDNCVWSR